MSLLVPAQAKLNLRLAILARESSGYHSIETIFHKLELADDVVLTLAPPGTRVVSSSVDVGPMEHNLAYRAAVAFLEAARWRTGFHIRITKRIPAGGGLGGGSADAAATLRGLHSLSPNPLPGARLMEIAAGLGADIPFLVSDAVMALGWGRGERLLSLGPLPQRHVALVLPDFHVVTAEAYGWVAAARRDYVSHAEVLQQQHLATWEGIVPGASNDFEPVLAERFPEIPRVIRALRNAGAEIAGMTGSGSTLFGIFDVPPEAAAVERAVGYPTVITRTARYIETVRRIG